MSTSSISLTDALRMFRMKNSEELSAFLHASTQRFSERGVEWYINGDRVFINKIVKKDHQIDTDAVIRKLLEYSYEIETHI